jgi:hypothetical protein
MGPDLTLIGSLNLNIMLEKILGFGTFVCMGQDLTIICSSRKTKGGNGIIKDIKGYHIHMRLGGTSS